MVKPINAKTFEYLIKKNQNLEITSSVLCENYLKRKPIFVIIIIIKHQTFSLGM